MAILVIAGSRTVSVSPFQAMISFRKMGLSLRRDITGKETLSELFDMDTVESVLCGCADGADRAGFWWARANGVPVEFFPAWPHQAFWAERERRPDETVHLCPVGFRGNSGFVRNVRMAEMATAALLFYDGVSRGTAHMKNACEERGVRVYVEVVCPA